MWNNFENRLIIDEVKAYKKTVPFLGHQVGWAVVRTILCESRKLVFDTFVNLDFKLCCLRYHRSLLGSIVPSITANNTPSFQLIVGVGGSSQGALLRMSDEKGVPSLLCSSREKWKYKLSIVHATFLVQLAELIVSPVKSCLCVFVC